MKRKIMKKVKINAHDKRGREKKFSVEIFFILKAIFFLCYGITIHSSGSIAVDIHRVQYLIRMRCTHQVTTVWACENELLPINCQQ